MRLHGKVVVIGVTGGIAAYKACEVVSSLVKLGASVNVIMTKNATEFVAPLTFETLSNNRVVTDMFDREFEWEVEHISLAKKADIFAVVPCTANFVGKFASGIADDFLSTTIMACKCPILLAPAMNSNMLASTSYMENVTRLKARGINFVQPISGRLACGDVGEGKLADVGDIVDKIVLLLSPEQDYLNKTALITCGPTLEPIDPVRYITNHSSGKMGIELAKAVTSRGGKVILVLGKVSQNLDPQWMVLNVNTTDDMYHAVMDNYSKVDYIIKAAAPADYKVKLVSKEKIKTPKLTLKLEKNPDIAKAVGKVKGTKKLVIFSAETNDLVKNAKGKLKAKNADMVVANDVTMEGAGFNTDTNIATIITNSQVESLNIMSKGALSHIILDKLLKL